MKHLIILKFNDGVYSKKVKEEINSLFLNLKSEINGVRKIELLDNIIDRPNNADLIVSIDFENITALNEFFASFVHKQFKEKFSSSFKNKLIFDFEE